MVLAPRSDDQQSPGTGGPGGGCPVQGGALRKVAGCLSPTLSQAVPLTSPREEFPLVLETQK